MKWPIAPNRGISRDIAVGEKCVLVPGHMAPVEVEVLAVSRGFSLQSGIVYLVMYDDRPVWVDPQFLWPLTDLAMLEKQVQQPLEN